jgi:hypothetical protein
MADFGEDRALWRSWSRSRFDQWIDPHDNRSITALASLTVRVPLSADLLPTPFSGTPDVRSAKHAIRVLVRVLNNELHDIMVNIDKRSAGL